VSELVSALENGLLGSLPLWIRELVVLAVFAALGFPLTRLLVRSVIPWLGNVLVEPLTWVAEMLGRAALFLDFAAARTLTRLERPLPAALYAYGDAVGATTRATREVLRKALRGLRVLRATPAIVIVLLMVAVFAQWNSSHCSATSRGKCVSPVSQWHKSLDAWRAKRHADSKRATSGSSAPSAAVVGRPVADLVVSLSPALLTGRLSWPPEPRR